MGTPALGTEVISKPTLHVEVRVKTGKDAIIRTDRVSER